MQTRTRIKLQDEIDNDMKNRIKRLVKTAIIQKYNTYAAFSKDFNKYLTEKGKRTNFTDRVLSNKLNRGDIRFFEVLLILDFLGFDVNFEKNDNF